MYVSSQELAGSLGLKLELGYFPLTTLRYPLIGILLYLLTIVLFQPNENKTDSIADSSKIINNVKIQHNNKSISTPGNNGVNTNKDKNQIISKELSTSDKLMFVHNSILCIFSLLCFINTAPVIKRLWENGWEIAVCTQWRLEYTKLYGFWTYLFYLSKFYEFVDTWIIMFKGRKPIFLQTFHHVGAVIGMWFCLATKSTGGYIFVVENSFIHTIMYFYYAVTILGYKPKFKYVITVLQMVQFVVGNSLAITQIYNYGGCMSWEDKATIIYHIVYTSILLALFRQFYKDAYKKKKQM